jgi:NAD(P)-dependent dehydrogenase (short-subunit alcohol dehydrogenase family)
MTPLKNTLASRVALVTGAGSGIGKAAAKLFSYAGARVAAVGRTKEELDVTVQDIRSQGGEALAIDCDVAKAVDWKYVMRALEETWGRLDIVVANAGINGVWAPLEHLTEEEWDETLTINLKGTFLTVKSALPLLKRAGGSIIITSSVNGTRIFSNTGATAYSCSKAAQVTFTKMTALELAQHKIRVNVICPGAIETRIEESTEKRDLETVRIPVEFPEGGVPLTHGAPGTAGQVAELIWFLASDWSTHITGTEIYIDGGQSLLQG